MFYLMTLSFSRSYSVVGKRNNYEYGALVKGYDKGSPTFSEENVSKCHILSTTNPIWAGLESSPCLRCKRPALTA